MAIKKILIKTPAKINLGLKVMGLRPDGYHEIETTMQMVALFDELTFEIREEGIELISDGEVIPSIEGNIVNKAFILLSREARGRGVKIKLKKNIPVAAGLGGGSSDAAATLLGLNKLWGTGLKKEDLIYLGSRLGSDVPFFLFGPSALARGRGDTLTPLRPLNTWVLLINPNLSVSTSWVYQSYDKFEGLISETKLLTKRRDNIKLPSLLKSETRYINDLEKVTIRSYPEVMRIKEELLDSGAEVALMSGSGPTVFGIFLEKSSAEVASKRFKGYKVFIVKTLTKSPLI